MILAAPARPVILLVWLFLGVSCCGSDATSAGALCDPLRAVLRYAPLLHARQALESPRYHARNSEGNNTDAQQFLTASAGQQMRCHHPRRRVPVHVDAVFALTSVPSVLVKPGTLSPVASTDGRAHGCASNLPALRLKSTSAPFCGRYLNDQPLPRRPNVQALS
jgi:hypothetical protein